MISTDFNIMSYASKNKNSNRMIVSKRIGAEAEDIFRDLMTRMGYTVWKSSEYENKVMKIDYYAKLDDRIWSFDVKMKDPDAVWIELNNIAGYKGSLYGDQTHFAYYYKVLNKIAVVKKKDLQIFVDDVKIDEFYNAPNGRAVPYHYKYTREGNKDVLIKTNRHLLSLSIPSYREYNL